MKLPSVARLSLSWLGLFLCWWLLLWKLSSGPVAVKTGIEIPHLDKVAHFGYFFGGAGLLSAFLFCRNPQRPNWTMILTIVAIALTITGVIDEWHQSWVPERTGNDAQDLAADVLGAITGFHVFKRVHRWLLP